jgi:probable HAF family extracellular repeat protein
MTDNSVSRARARFSRTIGTAIAALAVLSTAGREVDARHFASFDRTDLGTVPGGSSSEAFAVNAKGVVVGRSFVPDDAEGSGVDHAFVWSEDTGMTDLGTLGGTQSTATVIGDNGLVAGVVFLTGTGPARAFVRTPANVVQLSLGGPNSKATAINASGDVVGFSDTLNDSASHAFLWTARDGVMHDLGTLGGSFSTANAISDDGVVVGESETASGVRHAFMWTPRARMVDLGTLGFSSSAQGVNDDGVIVGISQTTSLVSHAFVWTRHAGMVDIGTDGLTSFGAKINGRFAIGQTSVIAGADPNHGFAWTRKTGLVDIGTLGGDTSFAAALNDHGLVVGNSRTAGNAAIRAFVWSASTGMMVALESGRGTSQAVAITDNFIVGSSCDADERNCHATLWKPDSRSRKGRDRDDD